MLTSVNDKTIETAMDILLSALNKLDYDKREDRYGGSILRAARVYLFLGSKGITKTSTVAHWVKNFDA